MEADLEKVAAKKAPVRERNDGGEGAERMKKMKDRKAVEAGGGSALSSCSGWMDVHARLRKKL